MLGSEVSAVPGVLTSAQGGKPDAQCLVGLIRRSRLDLSSEKRLQEDLAGVLERSNVVFARETRLNAEDIPDFFLPGGIVIECKMRGKARKIDVYHQLERYAQHDQVEAIILATNLSIGLPSSLCGKPLYFASLSAGWI